MNGGTAASQVTEKFIEPMEYCASFKHWGYRNLSSMPRPDYFSEDMWNTIRTGRTTFGLDEATRYQFQAEEVCRYRSFFVTRQGRFGLGPARLGSGDLICFIQGLQTPFVVHRMPIEGNSREQRYILRGECFVENATLYEGISDLEKNEFMTFI